MIVIGAYPDSITIAGKSSLRALGDFLTQIVPSEAALHVLPFYPSSGDFGFAPDNWFEVRADLGDWSDIEWLSSTRRVIVDGVYNHVGGNHHFVRRFFAAPSEDTVLYAFPAARAVRGPSFPRGVPVLRRYALGNGEWDLWQTFSENSFDIRLDISDVRDEIKRHLRFLAERGAWGVRLDGCAYYGKVPGQEQFHHPLAKVYARAIAGLAAEARLQVVAQLDCDPEGCAYFPRNLGYRIPVVDYAYSALLVQAILGEDIQPLAAHLRQTWTLPCPVIRPPRTHDGILLQSDLLSSASFDAIVSIAKERSLPIRSANGDYYELNSSLPYICSMGVDAPKMWSRLRMVIALTGFLPDWSYFYLPMLVGDIPELRECEYDDPRGMNRMPIGAAVRDAPDSKEMMATRALLMRLSLLKERAANTQRRLEDEVSVRCESALRIEWRAAAAQLVCNFSTTRALSISRVLTHEVIYSERSSVCEVEPLGFIICQSRSA